MDMNNLKENKKVVEIKNGDKNIDIKVIIIKFYRSNILKSGGKITTFLVGDESGSIYCNFFDNVSNNNKTFVPFKALVSI